VTWPPPGDVSRLGDDWRTRIPRDLARLAEAWQKPDAWAGMTRVGGGEAPAEMAGLSLADELVVHGWDVARATGQPYRAEPEVLDAAQAFLSQFASPDAPAGPDVPLRARPHAARRRAAAGPGGRAGRPGPGVGARLILH
jgi:uncharacterized protein (TIGR03086 family)